jgi:hypothetical protein
MLYNISHELLYSSRFAAAIMTSSLVSDGTVGGRPELKSDYLTKTLLQSFSARRHRKEQCSSNFPPCRNSSCVNSVITRTQNSSAVLCYLSKLKQELHRRGKINYSAVCYAFWTATCIWKSKRLRTDVYKIFYPLNFLNKESCYGELIRPFISILYRSQNEVRLAQSVSRLSYGLDDPGFEIW